MIRGYYKLPLDCKSILENRNIESCTLVDSIKQLIHLVVKTYYKEYRFDYSFGSIIWEKDFVIMPDTSSWRDNLVQDCEKSIRNFEKRLSDVQVNIQLEEMEIMDRFTHQIIENRKIITINLEGIIKQTNELFFHTETIFFSPLSMI